MRVPIPDTEKLMNTTMKLKCAHFHILDLEINLVMRFMRNLQVHFHKRIFHLVITLNYLLFVQNYNINIDGQHLYTFQLNLNYDFSPLLSLP